jgi:hypothetical protein
MRKPPPGRAADDQMQRSPEQDPATHRESSQVLQEEIAALVESHEGRLPSEALAEFERRLEARGVPPQPQRWMEAVAASAVEGRLYVVTEQALDDVGAHVEALDTLKEAPTEPTA